MIIVKDELSSIELFEETKIKLTNLLALEEINIDNYQSWYQKFFQKISNYTYILKLFIFYSLKYLMKILYLISFLY